MAEPIEVRILIDAERKPTVLVVYPDGRTEPLVATEPVQRTAEQLVYLAMMLTGQPPRP